MSDHRQQTPSRTDQQDARHANHSPHDGMTGADGWIAVDPAQALEDRGDEGRMQPLARYVHRDGLVQAVTYGDGRAPDYFVTGQPQAFPTAAAARQVLARAH